MIPASRRFPGMLWAAAAIVLCGASIVVADDPKDAEAPLFRDTFRPKLAEGWSWIREDPKHWRIGEKGLEVHVQPGNMWGPDNDAKNVLVRAVPADPQRQALQITAAVENHPTNQWEQVDLVWYYDDGHMVKIGEELVDGKLSVVMGREENDKARTISITPLDSETLELRLHVKANRIRGSFKTPKGEWREVGECDLPATKAEPRISLQFYRGPADVEHWARVSELTVRAVK
jgi:regulation of enolase protein 1 (concanavalin A-like superfamily)